ncbi:MAG: LPS export ABC transporter periplasmic protein LptC [Treponema sp.]|nr:LPS export ABC transporter periplasmic protein LptC [Treponema sp.]
MNSAVRAAFFAPVLILFAACSFDYGTQNEGKEQPNLILEDLEYVRVDDGNPFIKLAAEEARRYEKRHLMEIDRLSFEQFSRASSLSKEIPAVNAQGGAASAYVETDTLNLSMKGGVKLEVFSEDITITTPEISWNDSTHFLTAPGKIEITKSDGTLLTGSGFSADIRRRDFTFESAVEGVAIDNDDDNDSGGGDDDGNGNDE